MWFLRHDLFPLTAALLAALALLFVSTASMACEARLDPAMTFMSMSDENGPCEQKTAKTSCQKACLVFCQGLVPQSGGPAPALHYASIRYPSLDVRHADFTLEADDPPPRI